MHTKRQIIQRITNPELGEYWFDSLRVILIVAAAHHVRHEISHFIIRFDPDENRRPLISIASRHIFDQIDTFVIEGQTDKRRELYSLFLQSTYSRETAGWILDSAFPDH